MTLRQPALSPGESDCSSSPTTRMMHVLHSGQRHDREPKQRPHARWTTTSWASLLLLTFACSLIGQSAALDLSYCSSLNTASESTRTQSIYQSNGNCQQECENSYAFAVLQGSSCWCTNYAPDTSTSNSDCDDKCPGYPSDPCGNTKAALYAYISLNLSPSGTTGASSSTTAKSTTSTSSATSSTASTTPTISTAPQSTTTSQTTSSTPSSTQATAAPVVVTTVDGYKTIVITPSAHSEAAQTTTSGVHEVADNSSGKFFSHPGTVAGTFVGIGLGIAVAIGILLFFCYRRKLKNARMYANGANSPGDGVIPAGGAGIMGRRRSRSLSTLGLVASEKGVLNSSTSPTVTNAPTLPTAARTTPEPAVVDQRLDPQGVYLKYDPQTGSSRLSVRSLQDDFDYSRKLGVRNPD